MAYNKKPSSSRPLPGASIRGIEVLAPGRYQGVFEKQRLPNGLIQQTFVSMPSGRHILEEYVPLIETDTYYEVVVGLSPGFVLGRTDGGRLYARDAQSGEALTEQYAELEPLLKKAAELRLKIASPVIRSIKELNSGKQIYPLNSSDSNGG